MSLCNDLVSQDRLHRRILLDDDCHYIGTALGYEIFSKADSGGVWGLFWWRSPYGEARSLVFKDTEGEPMLDWDFKNYVEEPILYIAVLLALESGLVHAKDFSRHFKVTT